MIDAPGHEQYTRNMITGASTADAAVILVDARYGVTTQTRRHSHLVSLLGIEFVALAINKLDLVDFDQRVFDRIVSDFAASAEGLGFVTPAAIPVSALHGDNVTTRSERTPWYDGPTLTGWLHEVAPGDRRAGGPFRLPVQWVNRPNSEFRGVSGQIVGGHVRVGDEVVIQPSGARSRVARIVTFDGDLEVAVSDQAVTLVFEDDVDASRGDVICHASAPAAVSDELEVQLVWMHERELVPGAPTSSVWRPGARPRGSPNRPSRSTWTPASDVRRRRCRSTTSAASRSHSIGPWPSTRTSPTATWAGAS